MLSAPDKVKDENERLKEVLLPPNPAQVPNPIQPQRGKDQIAAEPVHHRQSEFPFYNFKTPVKTGMERKTGDLGIFLCKVVWVVLLGRMNNGMFIKHMRKVQSHLLY